MESGLIVIIVAAFVVGAVAIVRFKKKNQQPHSLHDAGGFGGSGMETHALKEVKVEEIKPTPKKKPGRKPAAKKAAVKKQK